MRRMLRLTRQPAEERQASTRVGNIEGSKGIALGPGARSFVIEISSLFNLGLLLKFFHRHLPFLILNLMMQVITWASWRHYADRFLIPLWLLLAGISLVQAGLLAGYRFSISTSYRWANTVVVLGSILGLLVLTVLEHQRVIHPERFDTDVFGVAVAHFGEGPDFRNTPRAREVNDLVMQGLELRARDNPELQFVQFKSIGLIRNQEEALEEGHRIGADLVIWGQLQVGESVTSLHFAVLETPDNVSNPAFPRVVPVLEPAATGIIEIPSRKSEEIAAKTTSIATFTFGLAHFFKTDFRSAVLTLEEALQNSPDETDYYLLHLYYGLSLQGVGSLEDASKQFKLAASLKPEDPAALLGLGFGYRSLGLSEEAQTQAWLAIDLSTKHIKLRPNEAAAFYARALGYEILEDWGAALVDYEAALDHENELYVARLSLVRMLIALGRTAEAVQASKQAIELAEYYGANPAWAYLYQAQAYQASNNPAEARSAFQKSAELAPEVAWIHFRAARFYEAVDDLESAHAAYTAMIEVSNTPASAHAELASFLARTGFPEAAIEEFQRALQIDPAVGGSWIALGAVHAGRGHSQEAQRAYERAVSAEPNNYYGWAAYGNFHYAAGDLEEAIKLWKKAIGIDPGKCNVWLNMGTAYESLGKIREARDVYTQVLNFENDLGPECHSLAQNRLNTLST